MATNLEIANQALLEIGGSPITDTDFTTPTSSAAKVVAPAFTSVLREVLSIYDFPVLRETVELTSAGSPPNDTEFEHYFDLPADFNGIVKVATTEGCKFSTYRISGTVLMANESSIFLHYTKKITDASVLPDYLISPIVYKLAARIAKPLTGEINEREMLERAFEVAFKKAKRRASQDKKPLRPFLDSDSTYIGSHQGTNVI